MKFIFIGSKAYNDLVGRIEKIEKAIITLQRSVSLGSEWLDSDEVCAILHISKRTLQRYRSSRRITFSVVSHKMLYSKTSILKMLSEKMVCRNTSHQSK
ncbi:MAG: helix-turn-helix domain-containing protein [Alistipes sp.]|nr:helix-turn-helix domain-containing protein [Alistipes sp.]